MFSEAFIEDINEKKASAWEDLYTLYYGSLCSYSNNIIQDRDLAKDIAQDILIAIWKLDKKFISLRELTLYLYRACHNNTLMHLRNSNLRREVLSRIEIEVNDDPDPDRFFTLTLQEELMRQLYLCVNELPAGSRRIIELSIRGMSGPEIARELGVTINTVKTQKSRALKFLREKLKDSPLLTLLLCFM